MQLHTGDGARIASNGFFRVFFIVLSVLLVAALARSEDRSAEVDKIFSDITPTSPGCACAVLQDGKITVSRSYGSADLERDVAITAQTVFDAGSLQKQFVAASILLLVDEKRISLSDDVHKYIPELPDYGHAITIDHLLTHTGGVRDWTSMLQLSSEKVDALTMILRQRGLNFVPGEEWSYSNSGYVLLKEIIKRVSGMPFSEFSRTRLFEPLAMKSSSYHENMRDVVPNRAMAYQRDKDGWRAAMLLDNDRGGGGLLTSASDLVIWNDAIAGKKLGMFVTDKMHERATLNNGRKLEYCRGVIADTKRGETFYWHSGSADGYKALLARFPKQNLSIAIMCNSGDGTEADEYAMQIFNLFAPLKAGETDDDPGPPPAAVNGVDVATLDLASKAGLFLSQNTGDAPLQLVVQGKNLRVAGGPGLVAQGNDRFKRWGNSTVFMSADEFELRFISNDELEYTSMEGKVTTYHRAQPGTLTADQLQAFAGHYRSDELGAVFVFEPGDGMLMGRLEHLGPEKSAPLKPVQRDTFQIARMLIRFERDQSGKIIGLDYSNPVVRHVKFTRV
jgi:CubicO group peptidase (beta-lactamase class C family)